MTVVRFKQTIHTLTNTATTMTINIHVVNTIVHTDDGFEAQPLGHVVKEGVGLTTLFCAFHTFRKIEVQFGLLNI